MNQLASLIPIYSHNHTHHAHGVTRGEEPETSFCTQSAPWSSPVCANPEVRIESDWLPTEIEPNIK